MPKPHLSFIDNLIITADHALRTLAAGSDMNSERPSPAKLMDENTLSDTERKQVAASCRI